VDSLGFSARKHGAAERDLFMNTSRFAKIPALIAATGLVLSVAPMAWGQLVRVPNTTLNLSSTSPPATLSATGAFSNLATLTPNPGIVPFAPNVSFWSDYAQKSRWFSVPDITQTIVFNPASNWIFPNGTVWIKQFNLPNERTNPNGASRRIETRFLVKSTDFKGAYGLTYKWRADQTDADLVGVGGEDVSYGVLVNGVPTNQVWHYPGRFECVRCHTAQSGTGLGFNTWQMNAAHVYGSQTLNQIKALSDAGYFATPVSGVNNLPAFAKASDTTQNLEWRVRSYLAANCIQCHQPNAESGANWDARPTTLTDDAQMINGKLAGASDPNDRFAVPGDTSHSMVWKRIQGISKQRMPPLSTTELDPEAIQLLTDWITQDLPVRLSFPQWQTQYFGSTTNPDAAPGADPDHDNHKNMEEFLSNTDPTRAVSAPAPMQGSTAGGQIQFQFTQPANRAALVETSTNFSNWTLWDVPGNSPSYPPTAQPRTIVVPVNTDPRRLFRLRLSMP
jgi:mono/diheme cytochrome c family protein